MAKATEPRPRVVSAGFAIYALAVVVAAYLVSPQLAPYVDPGATFWISTGYVLLGAAALAAVCSGAIVRARHLEDRLDELEALQRRVHEIEHPVPPAQRVRDSGSADAEVEALLNGLTGILEEPPAREVAKPSAVEELLRGDTWEMGRLRKSRDAVGVVALGPAVAAIALVAAFAPLLPASDGMLQGNLQLSAFAGVAGLGILVGLAVYAVAAFRQIRPRPS